MINFSGICACVGMNGKKTVFTLTLGFAMLASAQTQNAPVRRVAVNSGGPTINLFSNTYTLGSYNQKYHPTWEFTSNEDINAWTSLVTLMDRTDAKTVPEMDRLAEGIMTTYKNAGGRVLTAKTLKNEPGVSFNYMLVAFVEPAKHRYELNYVKIGMGPKNAYVMIIGLRVSDPNDYKAKTKAFLEKRSGEVGSALGNYVVPDLSTFPRRVF